MTPHDRTANGRFRILVIANETIEGDELHNLIIDHALGRAVDVVVVAPARRNAGARLERSLDRLAEAGISSYGWVGDADPLVAIDDALAIFPADVVLGSESRVLQAA